MIESLEDEFVLNNFDVGMPPSSTFLRTMYRARREVIPPNPPSQSEIDVSGDILYLNDCSIVHGDDQGHARYVKYMLLPKCTSSFDKKSK